MTHVSGREKKARTKRFPPATIIILGIIFLIILAMVGMGASKIINSKWNHERNCIVESADTRGGGDTGSPGTTQKDDRVYVRTKDCGNIILQTNRGASGNREAAELLNQGGTFKFRLGYIQVYRFFGKELVSDSYSKA